MMMVTLITISTLVISSDCHSSMTCFCSLLNLILWKLLITWTSGKFDPLLK